MYLLMEKTPILMSIVLLFHTYEALASLIPQQLPFDEIY